MGATTPATVEEVAAAGAARVVAAARAQVGWGSAVVERLAEGMAAILAAKEGRGAPEATV